MKSLMKSNSLKNYFDKLRKDMVDNQIIARGINNEYVIQAMLKVPRHLFVPKHLEEEAYNDYPLPIGENQTISQPYMVAEMTAQIEPQPHFRVLEIGTGSGYQSAILAEIVKEVYTIEKIEKLATSAMALLKKLGYNNIFIKVGDGTLGYEEAAPYDAIIVTAGTPKLPYPLFEQLKEGGIIVAPIGGKIFQTLTKIRKVNNEPKEERLFDCMFVPLIGEYGWEAL